ncbi:hypothetical protein PHJA_000020100 [Phtheirospermum japonicum]|uniref:DUF1421 domain-containing protein n=1 Tax=Phtheirospermum japonicum TaxID=374723 RepID=A0A830AXN1_9LAMI|nr:hypothetical protein PHJA_000020100 [Phtheirospermum japonicum]
MASGSSGRASHSGSKAFDFGSDDILCSYEDYGNQDGNNGIHSDPPSIANPAKEFNKSRVARSSVFPSATYGTPEESPFNEGVISSVENTMKKYTDNLMRFLEGISSRLSQLELYCYNLDKSIGEMRSDLSRDHAESESKLKSLERHIQEVHRSVQILRDKQELADTQKELAKLHLTQKDSSSGTQQNEERTSAPSSEPKKGTENPSDGHDQQQQLALALPHQVAPQQPSLPQQPSMAPPQPSSIPPQSMAYYLPPQPQMTANQTPQYLPATQTLPQVNQQGPQQPVQSLSPYQQQQWPVQVQPLTQQQPQIRTSSQMGPVYSPYQPPAEMAPNMQKPSFVAGSEVISYGYGVAGRPIPQQQPPPPQQQQHLKNYGPQSGDGYVSSGPRPAGNNNNNNAYMVFDGEGGRTTHHHHLPPHFQQQNAYPPTPQRMPPSSSPNNMNMVVPPTQSSVRGHPYNELIDKLVGMGYRGDHVVAIIQRLDENGQPIDFNTVLDVLNGHTHSRPHSAGSQRGGWSG